MELSAKNAKQVATTLLDYLQHGSFAWISLDKTDGHLFTFMTGASLRHGGWADHSLEAIRVWNTAHTRISFRFGHHYFTLGDKARVEVTMDGLKIYQTGSNGHETLDWIKREGRD